MWILYLILMSATRVVVGVLDALWRGADRVHNSLGYHATRIEAKAARIERDWCVKGYISRRRVTDYRDRMAKQRKRRTV